MGGEIVVEICKTIFCNRECKPCGTKVPRKYRWLKPSIYYPLLRKIFKV